MESILTAVGEIEGKGAIWHVGMAIQAKLAAEQGDTKAQLEKSLSHLAEARQLNAWWSRIPALMAEVYDRLGREDGALQAYLDAISRGDRNPASIHRAVQLLYKRQDNEGVEKLIRQLAAQPNLLTSEASRMASELLLRRADFQQAMQMARDTAAQSKDYQDHIWLGQVLVVAAQEDVAQRRSADLKAKLDEAEKSLRHAIELAPGAALPWTAWIRFLTQAGRTDEAAKAVAEAEQKIPEAQRRGAGSMLRGDGEARRGGQALRSPPGPAARQPCPCAAGGPVLFQVRQAPRGSAAPGETGWRGEQSRRSHEGLGAAAIGDGACRRGESCPAEAGLEPGEREPRARCGLARGPPHQGGVAGRRRQAALAAGSHSHSRATASGYAGSDAQ